MFRTMPSLDHVDLELLATLADDHRATVVALADRLGLPERSIGMSGDVGVAVEEGATIVRIGSALVGPRPPRDA